MTISRELFWLVRLRLRIEAALGLEHQWRLVRRKKQPGWVARCRWCGLYKARIG